MSYLKECLTRVKTGRRNRLNKRNLDALKRIGEEGPEIDEFNVYETIDYWFNDWVRSLFSKKRSYPEKRQRLNDSSVVDISVNFSAYLKVILFSSLIFFFFSIVFKFIPIRIYRYMNNRTFRDY